MFRFIRRPSADPGRGFRDAEQPVEVDVLRGLLPDRPDPLFRRGKLFRRDEAQMTGWHLQILYHRKAAEHGDPRFPLDDLLQTGVVHRRNTVENDAGDPVVRASPYLERTLREARAGPLIRFKGRDAADHRGQRHARALAVRHKNGGRFRHGSGFEAASADTDAAEAVEIAHRAFDHCDVRPRRVMCEQPARHLRAREKAVEIAGPDTEHRPVKHRIDVVRSALERGQTEAARLQRGEDTACHGRLAASALRRRDQDS